MIELFGYCYLKDISYAESTRLFIHSLFGKYGIVTIDANKKTLKKFFKPTFKNEIKNKKILSEQGGKPIIEDNFGILNNDNINNNN